MGRPFFGLSQFNHWLQYYSGINFDGANHSVPVKN